MRQSFIRLVALILIPSLADPALAHSGRRNVESVSISPRSEEQLMLFTTLAVPAACFSHGRVHFKPAVRIYRDREGVRRIDVRSVPPGLIRRFLLAVAKEKNRVEIFLFGGAVRDLVLGRKPKDLDYFVTGDAPQAVENRLNAYFGSYRRSLSFFNGDSDRFRALLAGPELSINRMVIGFDLRHKDPFIKDYPFQTHAYDGLDDLLHRRARLVGKVNLNQFYHYMQRLMQMITRFGLAPIPELEEIFAKAMRAYEKELARFNEQTSSGYRFTLEFVVKSFKRWEAEQLCRAA